MKRNQNNLKLISESLKALAHPNRIGIITLLEKNEKNKFSVSQIRDKLKLNQPETSRHLSILKNREILIYERIGSNIFYSINEKNVIFKCIENLLNSR